MAFRENLRSQLDYLGMFVKELAALSGVKQKTIESYLGSKAYTPSAIAAVSIAKVLGVSVEYLVTGNEEGQMDERPISFLPKDIQDILFASEYLNPRDRQIVLTLARSLKKK